jgi:hypothetical protein
MQRFFAVRSYRRPILSSLEAHALASNIKRKLAERLKDANATPRLGRLRAVTDAVHFDDIPDV